MGESWPVTLTVWKSRLSTVSDSATSECDIFMETQAVAGAEAS